MPQRKPPLEELKVFTVWLGMRLAAAWWILDWVLIALGIFRVAEKHETTIPIIS